MTARRTTAAAVALTAALALSGCTAKTVLATDDERLQVVTTTGLIRDLVQNVGGDHLDVASLVPDGADPHTYEPTLRDARNTVYADVAFSNYALLEEHSIIKTLDANLQPEAVSVSLAEEAVKYAAEIIPLVENVNLDTVWLGMRATGDGRQYAATRASEVLISMTGLTGPGDAYAYLTGTFGDTDVYFDSSNGFDAATGYRDDTMSLPADAHTHLSWAFSEPGVYEVALSARVQVDDTSKPQSIGAATFTFAVGVAADDVEPGRTVIEQGHADLTADLDRGELGALYDPSGGGEQSQTAFAADAVVIDVPAKALSEVPDSAQFDFLRHAGGGDRVYQLPQAVLGKHVHGEIDPHLWQNARNGMAYVQLIRDTLIAADPGNARDYTAAAATYLAELETADAYLRDTIAQIPESRRHLITSHDAFGYLAAAYDVKIAGFVTPNPATEPSLADRRKLTETLRTLKIPAVFLEPNHASRSSVLTELAAEQGVDICHIYGDALDDTVPTYLGLLRFNADSLLRCLG